jgi:hypothetical protein
MLFDVDEGVANIILSPGSYALTLTREDVVVWIINHDVSCDYT